MHQRPRRGRRKSVISGSVPQYKKNRLTPSRYIGGQPKNSVPTTPPVPTGGRFPTRVLERLKRK